MPAITTKIKNTWNETELWKKTALLAFVLNFFLVAQIFLPNLGSINVWDEADYVTSGKFFVEGLWPSYSWNPLVAIVYAIFYFFTRHSPFWFLESVTLGRVFLFCLLWLSCYLIARELKDQLHPAWILGIAFVSPLFTDLLRNPSDTLFAVMSGFAFWQLLAFHNTKKIRNLAGTSFFLGLAALSRNDGLVLFFIVLILAFFLAKNIKINWGKWALALVLPFWLLVGGYVVTFWAVRGEFEFGTPARSYIAFMQGNQIVYTRTEDCKQSFQKCAVLDGNQKYGTGEENNNSILRAILRNPAAYLVRLERILLTLPDAFYQAYGMRLAYVFILLSALGLFYLFHRRKFVFLFIFLAWPIYLGVYFLTFFRPGYIQAPYFIVFILSGFGFNYLYEQIRDGKRPWLWAGILAIFAAAGFIAHLPSLYYSMLVLAAAYLGAILLRNLESMSSRTSPLITMFFFLAAGLLIRGDYPLLIGRTLGEAPEEKAVLSMQASFPANTLIGAGSRGVIYASNMRYLFLGSDDLVLLSDADLHATLLEENVKGIYVDPTLSRDNRVIWNMIENGIGKYYETLYSDDEGSIRVLKLIP